MPKAITQHYYDGQAQGLQEWTEARKRERRVQVIPRTEITEAEEISLIVESIDVIGRPIMWAAIVGVLVLMLVNHYGWAIVPMVGALVGLRRIWGRLWGCKNERN